ncbi:hypothetical protein ACFFVB_00845 [Formosa undariae]|uniref:DUF4198 domain-containing protein n=1 Tax=Formosa undariae TaxID=1325436 RepID=A0ABV5EWR6_9FLAO
MKLIKSLFILLLFCACTTNTFAHALFINANTDGKIRDTQNIIIFYAEAKDAKKERIEDWWSDTKDFTLWLTFPNGTQEKLNVSQHNDHFTSSFTPLTQGDYYVSIHHTVSAIVSNTQYQFNASSKVKIGKQKEAVNSKEMSLENGLFMYKIDTDNKKEISIVLLSNGDVLSDTAVTIFTPNGSQQTIKTNDKGIVSLQPESQGTYLFEAFKKEDVSGEAYSEKFRIITSVVNFK